MDPMAELRKQMRITYDLMGDPEMATSMAKMYRNLYEALKKENFTHDQAMQIVSGFKGK